LMVLCVYFQRKLFLAMSVGTSRLTLCIGIESIVLTPCDCSPAPTQLISRGFFPCAPIVPTLAVDIEMLQFLGDLFVRIPPNNTAWTETLEAVWARSQYKLETRVRRLYIFFCTARSSLVPRIRSTSASQTRTAGIQPLSTLVICTSTKSSRGLVTMLAKVSRRALANSSVDDALCALEQPTSTTPILCEWTY
jgi:hypothetical protein